MEDIETFVGVHLGPGTLYGAIARLETQGLIEPLPAEERRRPYRLTASGIACLHVMAIATVLASVSLLRGPFGSFHFAYSFIIKGKIHAETIESELPVYL